MIFSLSFGELSAINKVSVVRKLGVIFLSKSNHAFCKNHIKEKAQVLLFPSLKGWFLMIKYNRFAAFSSTVG